MLYRKIYKYPFCAAVLILFLSYCSQSAQNPGSRNATPKTDNDSIVLLIKSQKYYADRQTHNSTFRQHYATAIEKKDYERAKVLVAAYGCAVDNARSADTNFVDAATAFVEKKYPVVVDSPYAMILHFISWDYFLRQNLDMAKYWAQQSLAACTFPNADRTKPFALSTMGSVCVFSNKIDSAIIYYLMDAAIGEAANDSAALPVTYFNIGSCYFALGANEHAKNYYDKAATRYLAQKDTSYYLRTRAHLALNNETFFQDSLSLQVTTGEIMAGYRQMHVKNFIDSFYCHLLYAKQFIQTKDYANARKQLNICKNIQTQNQHYELDAYFEEVEAEWFLRQQKPLPDAGIIEQDAIELEKKQEYNDASYLYRLLARNAANQNNAAALARFKAKEESTSDSVTQNRIRLYVLEADLKFQTQKKEQQIALQQKTIESKNRSIFGLLGGLLFLTTCIVALYLYQKQKRLKKEKQDALLYSRQLLEKTEEERKRIATDLHDSISSELLSLKSTIKTDVQSAGPKIDGIINDIRIIGRNLHPVMFDKVGLQNSIEQLAERV